MTNRRDFLIGGACLAGSAGAFGLTPRRRISLMGERQLSAITPAQFGSWTSRDVTDLVAPNVPGSLMDRLYNQVLERVYVDAASGVEVMMLLAHGDTQSAELQLHRPEVCYPAFGYEISRDAAASIALGPGPGAQLPVRTLLATAPGRRENLVYWTRLGQFLPTTEMQQRVDRMKTALGGYIADGLLARFSIVSDDAPAAWAKTEAFIQGFLAAAVPSARSAFVGSRLAAAMSRA